MIGAIAEKGRLRRHLRIRKKVAGSADRPRLVVHRSHKNLYAQIVDDLAGKTLLSCSTRQASFRQEKPKGSNVEAAKFLGEKVAQAAKSAGLTKLVLDRSGYRYHGRVKALTEAVRAQGIQV
ncbi:MAG: 50S ribosomal protein L18 [Candidatus Omnitrophica bacterium]|nr:50S ribosomal protein L18 [Candidatus Omnitrophota bacterium]